MISKNRDDGGSVLLEQLREVFQNAQNGIANVNHKHRTLEECFSLFSMRPDGSMGPREIIDTCDKLGIESPTHETAYNFLKENGQDGGIQYTELFRLVLLPAQHTGRSKASLNSFNSSKSQKDTLYSNSVQSKLGAHVASTKVVTDNSEEYLNSPSYESDFDDASNLMSDIMERNDVQLKHNNQHDMNATHKDQVGTHSTHREQNDVDATYSKQNGTDSQSTHRKQDDIVSKHSEQDNIKSGQNEQNHRHMKNERENSLKLLEFNHHQHMASKTEYNSDDMQKASDKTEYSTNTTSELPQQFWEQCQSLSAGARHFLEELIQLVQLANEGGESEVKVFKIADISLSGTLTATQFYKVCHSLGIESAEYNHCTEIVNTFGTLSSGSQSAIAYAPFINRLIKFSQTTSAGDQDVRTIASEDQQMDITSSSRIERLLLRTKKLFNLANAHHIDYRIPFEKRDMNITGLLSMEMMNQACADLGLHLKAKHRKCIREMFGDPATKCIRYSEFLRTVRASSDSASSFDQQVLHDLLIDIKRYIQRAQSSGVTVYESFIHFDRNGDGRVDSTEFVTGLDALGIAVEPSKVARLLARFDNSVENVGIDYGQFLRMVGERDEYFVPTNTSTDSVLDRHGEEAKRHNPNDTSTCSSISQGGVVDHVRLQQATFSAMHRKGPFVAGLSDSVYQNSSRHKAAKSRRKAGANTTTQLSRTKNKEYNQYLEEAQILKLIRVRDKPEPRFAQKDAPPTTKTRQWEGVAIRHSRTSAGYIQQTVKQSTTKQVDEENNFKIEEHRVRPHNGKGKIEEYTGVLSRPQQDNVDLSTVPPSVPTLVKRIGYAADIRNDYPRPKGQSLLHCSRNVLVHGTSSTNTNTQQKRMVTSKPSGNSNKESDEVTQVQLDHDKKRKLLTRVASVQREANELWNKTKEVDAHNHNYIGQKSSVGSSIHQSLRDVLELRTECFSLLCYIYVPDGVKGQSTPKAHASRISKHFNTEKQLDAVESIHKLFPIGFLSIEAVIAQNNKTNSVKQVGNLDESTIRGLFEVIQALIQLGESYAAVGARSTAMAHVQHALHALRLLEDIEQSKQNIGFKVSNQERVIEFQQLSSNSNVQKEIDSFAIMHKLFNRLDTNGDGQVTIRELLDTIRTQYNTKLNGETKQDLGLQLGPFRNLLSGSHQDFLETFSAADKDDSGTISWPEFIAYFRTGDSEFQSFLRTLEDSLSPHDLMRLRGLFLSLEPSSDAIYGSGFVKRMDLAHVLVNNPTIMGKSLSYTAAIQLLSTRKGATSDQPTRDRLPDEEGVLSWEEFLSCYVQFRTVHGALLLQPMALLLLGTLCLKNLKVERRRDQPESEATWKVFGKVRADKNDVKLSDPFRKVLQNNVIRCASNRQLLKQAREALIIGFSEQRKQLGEVHVSLIEYCVALAVLYKCEADVEEQRCRDRAREIADTFLCSRHGRGKVKAMVNEMISMSSKKNSQHRVYLNHFDAENAARNSISDQYLQDQLAGGSVKLLRDKCLDMATRQVYIIENSLGHRCLETALAYIMKSKLELACGTISNVLASLRTSQTILSVVADPQSPIIIQCTVALSTVYARMGSYHDASVQLANAARAIEPATELHTTGPESCGSPRSTDDPAPTARSFGVVTQDSSLYETPRIVQQQPCEPSNVVAANKFPINTQGLKQARMKYALYLWQMCCEEMEKDNANPMEPVQYIELRMIASEAREQIVSLTKALSCCVTDPKLFQLYLDLGDARLKCGDGEGSRAAYRQARFISEIHFGEQHKKNRLVDRKLKAIASDVRRHSRELERLRRGSTGLLNLRNRSLNSSVTPCGANSGEQKRIDSPVRNVNRAESNKSPNLNDWKPKESKYRDESVDDVRQPRESKLADCGMDTCDDDIEDNPHASWLL